MTLFWSFLASYCAGTLATIMHGRYGERAEIVMLTACLAAVALSGADAALGAARLIREELYRRRQFSI